MAQVQHLRFSLLWALLCLLCLVVTRVAAQDDLPKGPSIPLAYCASVNTNDGFKPFYSDYQSEGRCFDNCTDIGYALAVVQVKDCWCSNVAPAESDQKPLTDCHISCPGYPPDYCGGRGNFAYIKLKEPSSTGDGEDTAPPTTSSSTTEPFVETVTVGGTVRTVTATPTGGGSPSLAEADSGGGLATGAAVGIAVGVIAALAVAGVFLWLWCIKRKRQEEDGNGAPSVHGSSGMMGTPQTAEVSSNPFGTASDASDGGIWDANGKRRSHLMPVDPRLDPFAKGIYVGAPNKSHESIGSLQDNQDYSRRVHQPPRVLRAVNPDPDED